MSTYTAARIKFVLSGIVKSVLTTASLYNLIYNLGSLAGAMGQHQHIALSTAQRFARVQRLPSVQPLSQASPPAVRDSAEDEMSLLNQRSELFDGHRH